MKNEKEKMLDNVWIVNQEVQRITKEEERTAMKNDGKSVAPDDTPV